MIDIPEQTETVLQQSRFWAVDGVFVYASVRRAPFADGHLLICHDVDGEITVVTRPERLSELDVVTVNPDRWALFAIDCANPFYCPGFLAKLAAAFSAERLDVLLASTFSRDLLFVQERERERGRRILLAAGVREGGTATADA